MKKTNETVWHDQSYCTIPVPVPHSHRFLLELLPIFYTADLKRLAAEKKSKLRHVIMS